MARGAQGALYTGHLQILVEPLQSIRPRFLGGFGIKVLACVVEEGVVGTLKHLHFVSLVSLRESRFQLGDGRRGLCNIGELGTAADARKQVYGEPRVPHLGEARATSRMCSVSPR